MTTPSSSAGTVRTVAGALLGSAGLLQLVGFLLQGGPPSLVPLADVALAIGAVLLAFGPDDAVRSSRIGRVALVAFGLGPLVYQLPLERTPWPVLLGMTSILLVTVATVIAAVSVARAAVLHGVARWLLAVVAADALLTAAMSSVQLGRLPFVYLDLQLSLVRPLALLVWGLAIALHGRGPAIRRRAAVVHADWKRTTDVGDTAAEAPVEQPSRP